MACLRFTPVHVATCVLIITFGINVYSETEQKTCDVRTWYLDLVVDGPLSGDLSEGRKVLKDKIVKMVTKYRNRAENWIDCSILTMYEDMLKADDTPPDSHSADDKSDAVPVEDRQTTYEGQNTTETDKNNPEESRVEERDGNLAEDTNLEDNTDKNSGVNDDGDDTDIDETDFGDDEDNLENSEGPANLADEQREQNKEQAEVKTSESKDVNSGNDDQIQTSKDEQTVESDHTRNDRSEKDVKLGSQTEKINGKRMVEELVFDPLKGYVKVLKEAGDEKADGIEDAETTDNQNKNAKDTEDKNKYDLENPQDEDNEEVDEDGAENKDGESQTESENKEDEGDSENKGDEEDSQNKEDEDESENKGSEDESKNKEDEAASENKEDESTSENKEDESTSENKEDEDKSENKEDEDKSENKEDEAKSENKDSLEEKQHKQDNGQTKRKTRLVEEKVFDTRRGYITVIKEVEVDEEEEVDEETTKAQSDEKTARGDKKGTKPQGKKEVTETSVEGTKTLTSTRVENRVSKEQERDGSQTVLEIIKQRCLERHHCDMYCYYGFSSHQCLDNYPDIVSKLPSKQNSVVNNDKLQGHTADTVKADKYDNNVDGESINHSSISHKSETAKAQHESDSETHTKTDDVTKGDGYMSGTRQSEDMNEKRHSEQDHTKNPSRQDFHDFTADLHRFELSFQQRASEYANKIQNLEIMIIKLENQLLGERLNKQNSTSSFSKLENHILRLENELLKLNQSYAYLKEENDILKSRQRKYLELGHDKQTPMNDSSAKHSELISKQQNKISELSSLLLNHTELFDKLHSRSQSLEGQNQALYQIVMNQTALISSIMKKMQELSEENLRQRQETQDLKTKLEMKSNSDRLLEKLDSLVSGRGPVTTSMVDDGQPEEIRTPLDIHIFFPRSPDAKVEKKPWTCNGSKSSRFCIFYSIILSPCPPFTTIYWAKCPHLFKDISIQQKATNEEDDGKLVHSVNVNGVNDNDNSHGSIQENNLSSQDDEAMVITQREGSTKDTGATIPADDQTGSSGSGKNTDNSQEDSTKEEDSEEKDEYENSSEESDKEDGEDVHVKDEPSSKSDEHKPEDENADNFRKHSSDSDSKEEVDASKVKPDDHKEKPHVLESAPDDSHNVPDANTDDKEVSDVPKIAPADKEVPTVPKSAPVDKKVPDVPKSATVTKEASTVPASPKDRKVLYTSDEELPKPKDCYGYYLNGAVRNGMYKIYVVGLEKNLNVYCDMKGGGWTVLLKRSGGALDFHRDWDQYKRGFGVLYSDHWIGNENLHYITNQDHYSLRVELKDMNREEVHAEYDTFWTENEDEAFRLHIGGYSGTAGDGFAKHNNMKFSTKDRDNDLVSKELKEYDSSCAKRFHSGWWYYKCYMSNLTGQYYRTGEVPDKRFDGVSWKPWRKPNISLKEAFMKIRPLNAKN